MVLVVLVALLGSSALAAAGCCRRLSRCAVGSATCRSMRLPLVAWSVPSEATRLASAAAGCCHRLSPCGVSAVVADRQGVGGRAALPPTVALCGGVGDVQVRAVALGGVVRAAGGEGVRAVVVRSSCLGARRSGGRTERAGRVRLLRLHECLLACVLACVLGCLLTIIQPQQQQQRQQLEQCRGGNSATSRFWGCCSWGCRWRAVCARIWYLGMVRSSSKYRYAAREPWWDAAEVVPTQPASGRAPAGRGLLAPRGERTRSAGLARRKRIAHKTRKRGCLGSVYRDNQMRG